MADPQDPNAEVPFHVAVPGLRDGEVPEGPDGALSRDQILRVLGQRAQQARQVLGLVEDGDQVVSFMDDVTAEPKNVMAAAESVPFPGLVPAAATPAEAPTKRVDHHSEQIATEYSEEAGAGEAGAEEDWEPSGPAFPDMERAAAAARAKGKPRIRVDMGDRGPVFWTVEQVEERRRFLDDLPDFWKRKRAEALEKFGPDVESGWDIAPPSAEKLARLLNLHGAGALYNLCATCKHAVQIVQPIADLGGMGKYHGIRTFCALIREEGGRNLEIGDEPTQFCSHHAWSLRLAVRHQLVSLRAGKSSSRILRAAQAAVTAWRGDVKEKA